MLACRECIRVYSNVKALTLVTNGRSVSGIQFARRIFNDIFRIFIYIVAELGYDRAESRTSLNRELYARVKLGDNYRTGRVIKAFKRCGILVDIV